MGNKIIYIKLKEGCKPIEYFRNSFDERKNYYYNLSSYAEDELEISKASIGSSYFLIALIHDNDKIIYSYLGTGTISHNLTLNQNAIMEQQSRIFANCLN